MYILSRMKDMVVIPMLHKVIGTSWFFSLMKLILGYFLPYSCIREKNGIIVLFISYCGDAVRGSGEMTSEPHGSHNKSK